MGYQELIDSPNYPSRQSGAAVSVLLYEEAITAKPIVSGSSGINASDDFEQIPIEESGNDGVDEIVDGRHTGQASFQGFWSAERNDNLPTRQTFLGKRYIILEVIGKNRPNAGQVINAYTGVKVSRLGGAHGARGPKTFDMTFLYERRYNGKEWASLNGLL